MLPKPACLGMSDHKPARTWWIWFYDAVGWNPRTHWAEALAIGTLALCLSVIFAWIVLQGDRGGLPEEDRLKKLEGVVHEVLPSRNDVDFRFEGQLQKFSYLSKAGQVEVVRQAVVVGRNLEIQVNAADLEDDSRRYVPVFAMRADGRVIRSFRDVSDSWIGDNRLAWALLAFCLPVCVVFLLVAWHERRKQQVRDDDESSSGSGSRL
jgi:hypothetical protein